MKAKTSKTLMVHLQLTEDEARMLKGLVQNPVSEDEGTNDANFRECLFDLLTEALGDL